MICVKQVYLQYVIWYETVLWNKCIFHITSFHYSGKTDKTHIQVWEASWHVSMWSERYTLVSYHISVRAGSVLELDVRLNRVSFLSVSFHKEFRNETGKHGQIIILGQFEISRWWEIARSKCHFSNSLSFACVVYIYTYSVQLHISPTARVKERILEKVWFDLEYLWASWLKDSKQYQYKVD